MMKRLLAFVVVAIALAAPVAHARGINASISDTTPYQGDTLVVTLAGDSAPVSGSFDGAAVQFFAYRKASMAVIPIPAMKKPGSYPFSASFADGAVFTRAITVRAKKFVVVDLGIPKELGLTEKGLTTKLAEQKVDIDAAVKARTDKVYFNKSFGLPLANNTRFGSTFGETRKTGNSIIHHWGIDLSGPEGAAVGAMSGGVVKRVYADTVYGKVIIIDHGEGIYSLYMHLQKQFVKEGDVVERGKVIGLLGHTGYATGPHLHLSLKVNSVSVDPARFVMAFK